MTVKRYHDGKLIILENEAYVTNEQGANVRRVEMVLEDGTEVIRDTIVEGSPSNAYPQASAPSEEDLEIPIVHATAVPECHAVVAATTLPAATSSPFAVVTGPPQPPRVAVVTGPPRPPAPPQVYIPSSSRYVYRDERTGVCVICGISAFLCLVICCCCFLPFAIIPIVWATTWKQDFDDDFFQQDVMNPN